VGATKYKIFRVQKFVWKGTCNEAIVKEVLRNILKVASKDGFELVVWPLVELTMRETFRTRRQSIFAAMLRKFVGKRIVQLSMCGYDWWF
jgi:hypothetical protein